jgi:transcriptional/translational regulatory protein YebC/TACO1
MTVNDRYVTIDKTEYQALLGLRDETHAMLQAKFNDMIVTQARMQQNIDELRSINSKQCASLAQADCVMVMFKEKTAALESENKRLMLLETPEKLLARNKDLEKIVKDQHIEIQHLQRAYIFDVSEKLRAESKQLREEVKALKAAIAAGLPK